MALIVKGAPMLAVCKDQGTFPFLSLGVPWDSPAKSVAELKGKRIDISSAGSLTDWLGTRVGAQGGMGTGRHHAGGDLQCQHQRHRGVP